MMYQLMGVTETASTASSGCVRNMATRPPEMRTITVKLRVLFEFDKAVVKAKQEKLFAEQAAKSAAEKAALKEKQAELSRAAKAAKVKAEEEAAQRYQENAAKSKAAKEAEKARLANYEQDALKVINDKEAYREAIRKSRSESPLLYRETVSGNRAK